MIKAGSTVGIKSCRPLPMSAPRHLGVYRTGPRPIRAAHKYGLNGGRPAAAPHGGRGSPHSPASHLGRPL